MQLTGRWSGAVGLACAMGAISPVTINVAGGEVIGYTTNTLIHHNTELTSMSQASADLVADGHTLVPVNALTSQADLAGIDRLVVGVVSPRAVLSTAQVDVIEEFVNNGGKLVFLGENFVFFDNNTAVGGRFGIVYPTSNPPEVVLTDIQSHPITLGPFGAVATLDGSRNQPGAFGSMSSPGPNGVSIIDFPGGDSAAVVIEPDAHAPGSGLVVAYSDINPWHDNLYLAADNRALWRNTFAYCPTPGTACAWDCGDGDGIVGVDDFLALLAQWGMVGTPCDIDGGGVGVDDFLALLANWGACP